jgi:dTDP-4-amino-4,6-dideoxygalactose transaminase
MRWRELPPAAYPMPWADLARASSVALGVRGGDPRAALMRRLEATHQAPAVVLTDSGTSALALALRLAVGDGVVAMPAWGCFDLVTAAAWAGVRVAFYDVVPHTLAPDDASLRIAASGARAIVAVHPFGLPANLTLVREVAARDGATVIEDAAMAGGGHRDGRPLGSAGDMSILSFGRGKGVGGGGGGALLLRGAWATRQSAVRDWMVTPNAPMAGVQSVAGAVAHRVLGVPALYGIPRRVPGLHLGETRYHAPRTPRGMHATAAYLALVGLAAADAAASRRRRAAHALAEVLAQAGGPTAVGPETPGAWGALRLPILDLAERPVPQHLGVLPSYPTALSDLEAAQPLRTDGREMRGARVLARALRTAPTHTAVTDADRTAIAAWYAALPQEAHTGYAEAVHA